jgi:hypothetical protein
MEFHKIDTLFKRDEKTFKVIEGEFTNPEVTLLNGWHVTEKIDGTNMRVMLLEDGTVRFGGKTDQASIPTPLLNHLQDAFPAERLKKVCWPKGPCDVVIYGEGYGPKIQKGGGNYRSDPSFRIFDVLVAGKWWLEWNNVEDVAAKLGAETVPVVRDVMTIEGIVEWVKDGYDSAVAKRDGGPGCKAEGIVAQSPFFNRKGERVMFKLKGRDFP